MSPTNPLLCLPFAGSGAVLFQDWQRLVPAHVPVMLVELPGHGKRFAEPLSTDVHTVVDRLIDEVADGVSDAGPVMIFGHSLGAVLAYEFTRRLEVWPGIEVAHLFVSGSPGPWTRRTNRATGLDDAEFVRRIEEFAGARHEAFDDPEILELLLPALRADVAMHEDYRPAVDTPIGTPITSIRGRDDTLVTRDEAAQWRTATSGAFDTVEFPGTHMYLVDSAPDLLRQVCGVVAGGARR